MESEDVVVFDVTQKYIKVRSESVRPDGTLILDVIEDIYRAARRWEASSIGNAYPVLVYSEGGNILPGGVVMPVHVILQNGWKIQCPNNCKKVEIYGHISSSDSQKPFAVRPDGHKIVYEELSKKKAKRFSIIFVISVTLLIIAEFIIAKWIYDSPSEMEPYSAFVIVLFTLIQLIGHSKNA